MNAQAASKESAPGSTIWRSLRWEWLIAGALVFATVLPLILSRSVPAFQQDWSWPVSRAFAGDWVSSFLGQWSKKGLGQPNLLPFQTYTALAQYALIVVLGPSLALAAYLAAVEIVALSGVVLMLRQLGMQARRRQYLVGLLYALGPVMFTRVQAGHLAFILAYALLPWLVFFTRRVMEGERLAVVWLGLAFALAASQPQFLLYGAVVVALAALYVGPRRHWDRLVLALLLGFLLQLQGIAPLLTGAARSVYADERPIVAWEQNLSAPPTAAAIGLGYFTHYYEKHALAGAFFAGWLLLLVGALVTLFRTRRLLALGATLCLMGFLICSGLNGPLAGFLQWAIANFEPAAAFRDWQYAAAYTALGTTVLVGCALDAVPLLALPLGVATALVIAPAIGGLGLRPLILPRVYTDDTMAAARMIAAHGPGRVLWLPSEEPVGLEQGTSGLDIAIYGLPQNPSANQERDLRILAFGVSSLRTGQPNLNVFRRLGIRYFVTRDYIVSQRDSSLGTGLALAFHGIADAELGGVLKRTAGISFIGSTGRSMVFALDDALPIIRRSTSDHGALLQSDVLPDRAALLPNGAQPLELQPSQETADPRRAWVSDFIGRWYAPWISDSIYPYVWTLSGKPIVVSGPTLTACALVAAETARLSTPNGSRIVGGHWRAVTFRTHLVVTPRGLTALSGLSRCRLDSASEEQLLVFASRYDSGWRVVRGITPQAPVLADGWAMAWENAPAHVTLIYIPAIEQGFALVISVVGFALLIVWVRRRP